MAEPSKIYIKGIKRYFKTPGGSYQYIKDPEEEKLLAEREVIIPGETTPLPEDARIVGAVEEKPGEKPGWKAVTEDQINELYLKYAGRKAYDNEVKWHTESHPISYEDLEKWASTAPEVKREKERIETEEPEEQPRLETALKIINDAETAGKISPDQAALWRETVKAYPKGVEVDPAEILATFEDIKTKTIDPHFQELTKIAQEDLRRTMDYLQTTRAAEQEGERLRYEERVRGEKATLERAGKTFTGEAIRQLGPEAAYEPTGVEGLIPQEARLIATGTIARHQEQMQAAGLRGEALLGTEYMRPEDIRRYPGYTPVGGITGELPEARERARAQYLQSLIGTAGGKQTTMMNIPLY